MQLNERLNIHLPPAIYHQQTTLFRLEGFAGCPSNSRSVAERSIRGTGGGLTQCLYITGAIEAEVKNCIVLLRAALECC